MLFEAEEDMWAVAPDWSAKTARDARTIFAKLGNRLGVERCDKLMGHLDAIERGQTGAVFYRRDETRPREIFNEMVIVDAPEIRLFCPSCRTVRRFSLRTCGTCGYMADDAPISRSEEVLGPDARLRMLFESLRKRR